MVFLFVRSLKRSPEEEGCRSLAILRGVPSILSISTSDWCQPSFPFHTQRDSTQYEVYHGCSAPSQVKDGRSYLSSIERQKRSVDGLLALQAAFY